MYVYIYIYKLSQSIAFNLSNVFHYLKTKKQQQKQIKQRPAAKLLPYCSLTGTLPVSVIEKYQFFKNKILTGTFPLSMKYFFITDR